MKKDHKNNMGYSICCPDHVILIIYSALTIFPIIAALWRLYLIKRQIKILNEVTAVPDSIKGTIEPQNFEKSRLFYLDVLQLYKYLALFKLVMTKTLPKVGLGMHGIWKRSMDLTKLLASEQKNDVLVSVCFAVLNNALNSIVYLPFFLYYKFSIQERHGTNKSKFLSFLISVIGNFVAQQFMVATVIGVVLSIVKNGGVHFYLWLWVLSFIIMVTNEILVPVFIYPKLDDFKPLSRGPLRTAIEALISTQHFPQNQLYLAEVSQQSTKGNAYVTGIFGCNIIVIYDTLLSRIDPETEGEIGLQNDQIVAIVAHELGHWKLNHPIKRIIIFQIVLLMILYLVNQLIGFGPLYRAVGFPINHRPIIIGFYALQNLLAPLTSSTDILTNLNSRKQELEADEYAVNLGFAEKLKNALIKLQSNNLDYPVMDWLFMLWFHAHPSILDRITHIDHLSPVQEVSSCKLVDGSKKTRSLSCIKKNM